MWTITYNEIATLIICLKLHVHIIMLQIKFNKFYLATISIINVKFYRIILKTLIYPVLHLIFNLVDY